MCLKYTPGKNTQAIFMIGLLVLLFFPILTLIVQNEVSLSCLINSKTEMEVNELFIRESEEISNCIQTLQEERNYASFLFSLAKSNRSNISEHNKLIQKLFIKTDRAILQILNWQTDDSDVIFDSKLRFQIK